MQIKDLFSKTKKDADKEKDVGEANTPSQEHGLETDMSTAKTDNTHHEENQSGSVILDEPQDETVPKIKNIEKTSEPIASTQQLDESSATTPVSVPGANAAKFINKEVLKNLQIPTNQGSATSSIPYGMAKPMADQTSALMLEDMRVFLQGTEQVLMIAVSKALSQVIETDGAEGTIALNQCESLMEKLPQFAIGISNAAVTVSEGKGKS